MNPRANVKNPLGNNPDPLLSVDFADLDKITEDSLGFSALTDGLGFHPKERKVGLIRPSQADEDIPLATPSFVDATNSAIAKARSESLTNLEEPEPIYKLAADEGGATKFSVDAKHVLGRRALAFLIDLGVIVLPLWLAFLWNFAEDTAFLWSHWRSAMFLTVVVFNTYLLISESLGGQSLGKMVQGLIVVEDDKYRKPVGFQNVVWRLIFFWIGLIPAGIGSLLAIWDSKTRTWHDRLTASAVEQKQEA